ncbi:MAG: LysR family transcriptional regulator [Devosia sp.]|uniref:LysR family transcriptional regulator n=1 Tax=Devosia sp. TaxID=1871048 RepID=UPI001A06F4F7|nr:LysR family transcriptional regulator [Devosia sp.]MBF0680319.1 LysR family transcriptional regulator [Devosia sp.]
MEKGGDFDWNQVRALLATVEAGSLSAAARQLGLTQPTLGRQVAALEAALGVTLFERLGRKLVLTQAGREFVAPLQAMGEAANRISLIASRQCHAIEGVVRVTTSDVYAVHVLPPFLTRVRELAPNLVIDVLASNEVEDLMRRRADIAIRHVRPEQDELIARRCPDASARIYGSRSYLDRVGRPASVEDLSRLDFVGVSERNDLMIAELARRGIAVTDRNFPLTTGSALVGWSWVRQGLGLGVMMEAVGSRTEDVEDAFPAFPGVPVPTWLATHRELRTSRRIRLVFDLLADHFKSSSPFPSLLD